MQAAILMPMMLCGCCNIFLKLAGMMSRYPTINNHLEAPRREGVVGAIITTPQIANKLLVNWGCISVTSLTTHTEACFSLKQKKLLQNANEEKPCIYIF